VIKIGVFFGGSSREREISFAGGRTVFDNLDKSIFEPVPIFIDSLGNLIFLDWQYVYKGTIRDFYPPVSALPNSPNQFQIYIESIASLNPEQLKKLISEVGKSITYLDLPNLIDFAFLALHGYHGEDGKIQGLLETLNIPYSGSGIRACAIGIDKAFQKKMMEKGGFPTPKMEMFTRKNWMDAETEEDWYEHLVEKIGFPMVVRPANQGSSIGVSIISEDDPPSLVEAINNAFFIKIIDKSFWSPLSLEEKVVFLRGITDIRTGIGFPLRMVGGQQKINHPEELLLFIDETFDHTEEEYLALESYNTRYC
jgi:UDP-N-acetylmuramate--alanine ligase